MKLWDFNIQKPLLYLVAIVLKSEVNRHANLLEYVVKKYAENKI